MVLFKGGEEARLYVAPFFLPGDNVLDDDADRLMAVVLLVVLELHVRTISTNRTHQEARVPVYAHSCCTASIPSASRYGARRLVTWSRYVHGRRLVSHIAGLPTDSRMCATGFTWDHADSDSLSPFQAQYSPPAPGPPLRLLCASSGAGNASASMREAEGAAFAGGCFRWVIYSTDACVVLTLFFSLRRVVGMSTDSASRSYATCPKRASTRSDPSY